MRGIVLIIILLFTSPCYGENSNSQTAHISIAGSSTCFPVVSRAAVEFMQIHPKVEIVVSPGGSGVGVRALAQGTTDIGMISRDLSEEERKGHPDVDFFLTPFARDAVVPVVSSKVYEAGITSLSLSQIRDIYSGKVKDWKALGGPEEEILVVDKKPERGTRHVFMKAIFGDEHAVAPGARLAIGSNDEEQKVVTESNSAIGMLSHAWMNSRVRGLGIKVEDETIYPTIDNIRNGHFPISRNLSFVTNGPPRGMVQEFTDFVLGPEGHRIILEAGLVPLE